MAEEVERRLTTILFADVAGYSRLMGRDEEGTLSSLVRCRGIVDGLIRDHRGRIANTAGDAVLAEFPSVADGLSCALKMQDAVEKEDQSLPPERRMRFRIGIHVGDVLLKGGDLFGDAVNIAARLAALAEPGGICASASVREHAGTRLPAAFADMGAQRMKNIAEPVHVYRVGPRAEPAPAKARGPQAAGTAAVPKESEPAPYALPDKPSIAVLPFVNLSSDPEQEFLADGVAEDIITALSRYPSLFVIARNSSFTYKGGAVDVKAVGRELGVRYVLEGSLRKAGSRIRVTAQLIEAESGKHLWAERYDRDLADIFALQDEIAEAVTIAVAPAVADAELQRAMRKPPENLDAWTAYQRGLWHVEKMTAEDNRLAEQLFQQAIDLDPSFAGGYAGFAYARINAFLLAATGMTLTELQGSLDRLARRAVALDPANAEARARLSAASFFHGDLEEQLREAERALALSPNLAEGHGMKGLGLIFSGRPREGLAAVETALRLDPRNPLRSSQLIWIVFGHYFCGDYEAAANAARLAIRSYPDFPIPYRWLAAALGQLERRDEAKEALQKAIAIAPASVDLFLRNRPPFFRPEDHAHMLEGLRKAGWTG
jgi:adenylate cyclase